MPLKALNVRSAVSRGLSRREFLIKSGQAALAAAVGLIGGLSDEAALAQDAATNSVPTLQVTAPALMLHSKDNRQTFLSTLIRDLQEGGYHTTTYRDWQQGLASGQPIRNPIIISIDDITMARGNRSFDTFRRMHDRFYAAGMVTVFAIITRPDLRQNEAEWDEIATWQQQGFELATHTANHATFNSKTTAPRDDFTEADYTYEIVESAAMIEAKLHERGIDYPVRTLVTPYGSGYSYHRPIRAIYPGIVAACAQTHIKFVVGIVQGKFPFDASLLKLDNPDLLYLGRTPPEYEKNDKGVPVPQAEGTFAYVTHWAEKHNQGVGDEEEEITGE